MSYLSIALENLKDVGLFDVIIPFLLVFTVIYAILRKTKILGDENKNKNFSIAIAFSIALLVVIQGDVVRILNTAIPHLSVVFIAVLMFLLMVGLLGGDVKWAGNNVGGWIAIISLAIVIYVFGSAAGWWTSPSSPWLSWINDSTTVATVIVLLVFGVLIWFITSEPDKNKDKDGFIEKLGKMFGKD